MFVSKVIHQNGQFDVSQHPASQLPRRMQRHNRFVAAKPHPLGHTQGLPSRKMMKNVWTYRNIAMEFEKAIW